ncbi:hypothetical protein CTI14_62600 [Methylobacterium radiotolerans]|nr:hypothetical protein CTI14_62600 [Methylobacterium radiotolerans]
MSVRAQTLDIRDTDEALDVLVATMGLRVTAPDPVPRPRQAAGLDGAKKTRAGGQESRGSIVVCP